MRMYKQKTRKTIMKRFKVTKTGKIMRGHHLARHKRITKSEVENKIKNLFGDKDKIKSKIIDKKEFLREYKVIYHELFSVIMDNIRKENGSKQK